MKTGFLALIGMPLAMGLVSCTDMDSILAEALGNGSGSLYLDDYDYYEDYDASGVPIYGYDGSQPVYGYDASYQPIYSTAELSNATYVPAWSPRPGASVSYPSRAQRGIAPPRLAKHRHAGASGLRGSARRVHHKPSPGNNRGGAQNRGGNRDRFSGIEGPGGSRHDRSAGNQRGGNRDRFGGIESPGGSRPDRSAGNQRGGNHDRFGGIESPGGSRPDRSAGNQRGGNRDRAAENAPGGKKKAPAGKDDDKKRGAKARR